MIRPHHICRGKTFLCFWILFQVYTVSHSRRYDKCTTADGREGVCVVKRYCREASHQELLPCERDEENHCCPIPTTQRSAQSFPSKTPERPRQDDRRRTSEPNPQDNRHPTVIREHDRDDRRPTVIRKHDRDDRRREHDRNDRRPTVTREHDRDDRRREHDRDDRRPTIVRENDRDDRRSTVVREHERDDRLNKTPPPGDRRPFSRPGNDRPKKVPNSDKADEYDGNRRRPYPSQGLPREVPPDRPRDAAVSRPSTRPKDIDRHEHPLRRPDADRFYPAKDELETSRATAPPRRDRVPPKNRTADDSSKAPIRFPEPYEFSVPRPKVPACGVKPYELFIAGGQESDEHEWPWMTAIFRRYPDSRPKTFLCGGSLINTKYVLTAAHCFVNNYVILPASSFIVRLGSHFLDSGEEYTVANLVIHHNHSGSDFFNDIALVRLASEVYITDKIAPICLPSPDMMLENFVGRLATVAGWGDTAFRTSGTRILQHVTVPVVSGEECFAAYSRVRGAAFLARGSDHVICAGLREGGKDACLGDSGGPLMLKMNDDRWIIVGIVSLGYKCAEPGYPGVYTRVTHYMSWINTNMKRH